MTLLSTLTNFVDITSLLKGVNFNHLAVMAPDVHDYGENEDNFNWLISFQVFGILAGAAIYYYLDWIYVAGGFVILNIIDWASLEYITEEANKVLAGEGSIVDYV